MRTKAEPMKPDPPVTSRDFGSRTGTSVHSEIVVAKRLRLLVARRQERARGRPLHADFRVIPADAALRRGVVYARHLVVHVRRVAHDAEAVRETDGDEQL